MQKNKEIAHNLEWFCLFPEEKLFQQAQTTYIKNNLVNYDLWCSVTLYKYAKYWGMEVKKSKTPDHINLVKDLLSMKPTTALIDKMWVIFSVTGEIQHLREAFEVAGNPKATEAVKKYAIEKFSIMKDSFYDRIAEISAKQPDYYLRSDTELNKLISINAKIFNLFDKLIQKKTKELNELEPEESGLLSSFSNKQVMAEESSPSDSESEDEEKKEKKKIIKEASNVFDDLSKKLIFTNKSKSRR